MKESDLRIGDLKDMLHRLERGELPLKGPALDRDPDAPWPPPDPSLAPEALAAALAAAPRVPVRSLLDGIDGVDLDVSCNASLLRAGGGRDAVIGAIAEGLARENLRIDPRSPLKLVVRMFTTTQRFERSDSRTGKVLGDFSVGQLRMETSLVIAARSLRGDRVRHTRAELASFSATRAGTGEATPEWLATGLQGAVARVVARARDARNTPVGPTPWSSWAARHAPEWQSEKFYGSFLTDPDLAFAGVADFDGFASLDVECKGDEFGALEQRAYELVGHGAPSGYFEVLYGKTCEAAWRAGLHAAGVPTELFPGPTLHHHTIMSTARIDGTKVHAWAARTRVHEKDLLIHWNGRFALTSADVFVDREPMGMVLSKQDRAEPTLRELRAVLEGVSQGGLSIEGRPGVANERFRESYDDCMRRLVDRMQWKDLSEEATDAPAIANTLRTRMRPRLQVPEAVIDDVATRIDHELRRATAIPDELRDQWRSTQNGVVLFDLEAVGRCRSDVALAEPIREAIDAAVERIYWLDPIGLYSFESPFEPLPTEKPSLRQKVQLPPGFADRLTQLRPSGGGALASERLRPALDVIMEWVEPVGDSADAQAAQHELYRVSHPLVARRTILVATYNPEGTAPGGHVETRYFWYPDTPRGWVERRDQLPPEFPFADIGPGCHAAPASLADANAVIELCREPGAEAYAAAARRLAEVEASNTPDADGPSVNSTDSAVPVPRPELEPISLEAIQPGYALPDASELKTTDSGLRYSILREGTGKQVQLRSRIDLHYDTWSLDGSKVHSSREGARPIAVVVGEHGPPGWTEGLPLTQEGGRILLVVPPHLTTRVGPEKPTQVMVVDVIRVR
ncbi:MAG: FKBP-type peptidyl-prolyl cis-trans isomerase [Planctomycetota bacterium]